MAPVASRFIYQYSRKFLFDKKLFSSVGEYTMLMPLLTVQECAARINVHEDTIRKAIRRGDLRAVKFGRQWAVDEADLERFIKNPPRMGRPPKP